MPSQNENSFLPEEDTLHTILNELKRTVSEYTTATTEAACPTVRSMFSNLTSEMLTMQGEMYQLIEQQKQYAASVPHALKSDIDSQLQQMQNTIQQTRQFTGQKTSGLAVTSHTPNVSAHPSNVHPTH
ncbi:spore coat protein [Paenibacillus faecalis]|uniref:spore coat protein n=1 Tax=Paenibacillus faecalis TaxID=2079532 RepID=UPI000D10E160|nr:spore coat protein [Paenibacillus faecalis]